MALEEHDLDAIADAVRAAAADAGSYVVGAVISRNDADIPVAQLNADDLVALIRAIKPRIVYCALVPFDAARQVLDNLFDDDEDEAEIERDRVKKLVKKWRSRDGQSAQVSAVVMADGIMHGLTDKAPWFAEYEQDILSNSDEVDQTRGERERLAEAEAKKRLDPFVKKLMTDPRFSGTKVGHAKRVTLAEEMFPDEDRKVLREIVDLAESRHWLASGR